MLFLWAQSWRRLSNKIAAYSCKKATGKHIAGLANSRGRAA
jgi:hypothetical protein